VLLVCFQEKKIITQVIDLNAKEKNKNNWKKSPNPIRVSMVNSWPRLWSRDILIESI
jgi:hypothetical protein